MESIIMDAITMDSSKKRARSLSLDSTSEERAPKSIKVLDVEQDEEDENDDEDDDEDDEDEDEDEDTEEDFDFLNPPETLELGGVEITNIKAISIDEHGDEIHVATQSSSVVNGLITPDPTPTGKDENPFEKVNPTLAAADVAGTHNSPANLAAVGDMKLFGFLPAKMYMYQHVSDELHPYDEVIKIAECENLSLGSLFPSFKGNKWDVIELQNTILGFQEEQVAGGALYRETGLYVETDVVFQGALQPVSDFFRDFFHQEKPALHMSAWLGREREYGKFVNPASIVLRGSLDHISVNVLDILEFKQIGVELTANRIHDMATSELKWAVDYGFFGKLNLTVPCTAIPISAEYYLRQSHRSWLLSVRLQNNEWKDVFGVRGLNLSDVILKAKLDRESEKSELSFSVEANLQLRSTNLSVRGSYAPGSYSIEAYIGNLTLQELGEIFHEIMGFELDIFDHDVLFNSMYLRISSDGGVQLHGEVTINGHTSARGTLAFSKDGIAIGGGVGDLEFEHVLIKEASIDVFVASKMDTTCARASKVDITGDVCFSGVELKVAVHTEKASDGEFLWTIYGEVEGDVQTSRLVPDLKGTFLDISLNKLALIASNHDMPAGSYRGLNYPVLKGFQFCAAIDSIPEIEQLMRGSVKGMVLRAAYSSGNFSIGIILPSERSMSFGDSVYTGPLEIQFEAGTDISLMLKAILNVKVDTQPDPLQFALGLKANTTGAGAFGQMLNDWTNPCNLGQQVVIRKCALQFGIVYTTFFTTGMPGEIGFAGELAVGSKLAGVAMKVSQNPKDQLLAAQIKDLGVVDLVDFASLIAEHEFPRPDDFVHFNDVELYISTGTTIGLTEYPAGASMKGDMTLFGKNAKFECTIGSKVKIMATIEHFDLGPLKIKGATRADPIVDIELSKDKQHVLIDGAVEIWGASAALHLEAAMLPSPMLDFFVDLRLSDLFVLQLGAKLKGKIDIKDIKTWGQADFEVSGSMEQHLIEHVVGQLEQQVTAAQEAAKRGFDAIKQDMEAKEAAFKAACQVAIDELEATRAEWNRKQAEVHGAFDSAKGEATRIRRELQDKVDAAERGFKSLVADKSAELESARGEATAAIREAEEDIDRAQRDSDDSIREAQGELQRVRQDFENGFGSAERDLESARHDVENAQRQVDSLDDEIRWVDRRIDDEPWYNCPPLIAQKAGLLGAQAGATASLQIVRGIFFAAEALVHGTGFVAAEAAIGAAEAALEVARVVKTEALDLAKTTLEGVKEAQEALINTAIAALHEAEHLSDELHVFDLAKAALEGGEGLAQGMIDGAQGAVDGLARCGEFIAFDVAEQALKFAQNNTSELNLARHAVEVAEGAVNLGLDIGKWVIENGGKALDIRKIAFSGSIQSLVHANADSSPLTASIAGVIFGKDFDFEVVWKPHFDLVEFIKALFAEIWAKIKSLDFL